MDLVVRNARLHPTGGTHPEPVDIGIEDGRFSAIRERGQLKDVIIGSLPFIVALFVMIGLIIAFPGIAMWLPGTLK